MKKILILVAVSAILFSSGCIEGMDFFGREGKEVTTTGVVVNEFAPDFSEVESGDKFDLYLEIENTGGAEATDVWAHLYGYDVLEKDYEFGTLEPPDEDAGIPGEIKDCTWEDIIAPSYPEGVVYEYKPRLRLMYDYKTLASANLNLLTKTEYRRLKERNQLSIEPITTQVTKGPVSIEINARNPIIIDDFSEDKISFRVNINIIGKGTVFKYSHDNSNFNLEDDELDKIIIKIDADGVSDSPGVETCKAFRQEQEISMRRGKTYVYSCELTPEEFSARRTIPISVEIKYGYFEEYTTTITVRGKGE